jgi:hypothetical protein
MRVGSFKFGGVYAGSGWRALQGAGYRSGILARDEEACSVS